MDRVMVRAFLLFRYLLLVAPLGALFGGLLMFGLAGLKLATAASILLTRTSDPQAMVPYVMGATDSILFGLVLVIFAYAIAFGFVFDRVLSSERVPAWMRPRNISELKRTLVEAILVYMVVDFATDLSQDDVHTTWTHLVIPIAIVLIAAAMRLLRHHEPAAAEEDRAASGG